jgi:hypothetical protein
MTRTQQFATLTYSLLDARTAGDVLQGLTAAAVVPQILALITSTSPAGERPTALAWFGVTGAVSGVLGQVLGVLVADVFGLGRRVIFFLSLPVGVAVLAFALRVLPRKTTDRKPALAVVGTVFFAVPGDNRPGRADYASAAETAIWICVGHILAMAVLTTLLTRRQTCCDTGNHGETGQHGGQRLMRGYITDPPERSGIGLTGGPPEPEPAIRLRSKRSSAPPWPVAAEEAQGVVRSVEGIESGQVLAMPRREGSGT